MTMFNDAGAFNTLEPGQHNVLDMQPLMHSAAVDFPFRPSAYGSETQCNGAVCGTIGCEHSVQACEERLRA
jgi:hypothetical protein